MRGPTRQSVFQTLLKKNLPLPILVAFGLGFLLAYGAMDPPLPPIIQSPDQTAWRACFTTSNDCTQLILDELDQSQKTIRVQAYSFTSDEIARALVRAHQRGVQVQVIVDKSQPRARKSQVPLLLEAGVPLYIDEKVSIAHNKVMILDDQTLVTGSFNFTHAAEDRNAENVLVVKNRDIAGQYTQNWRARQEQSRAYPRAHRRAP